MSATARADLQFSFPVLESRFLYDNRMIAIRNLNVRRRVANKTTVDLDVRTLRDGVDLQLGSGSRRDDWSGSNRRDQFRLVDRHYSPDRNAMLRPIFHDRFAGLLNGAAE